MQNLLSWPARHAYRACFALFAFTLVLLAECVIVPSRFASWLQPDALHIVPMGIMLIAPAIAILWLFLSLTQPAVTIDCETREGV